ncbi:DsbA family protein [Daejeonia sp. YH14]|uniref:DsbA family protein n=1 Tax=Daejeonia sp. YH14 TaxID=3439042 RepID=UPI003F499D69
MSTLHPSVNKNDHFLGDPEKAKVVLTEYGDYQCPSCGEAYPIVKNLQEYFGEDLLFVFRNFPLTEIHPNAFHAALAAEAAGKQNKFWEMHDILYENQSRLDLEALEYYAEEIGLNINAFRRYLRSKTLQDKVENDIESGLRSGVNGTPSFYINNEKYNEDWSEDFLKQVLQQYI